jgi:hypothetical protein
MLNADLTNTETAFPTLEAGIVTCIIAACAEELTKEKKMPVLTLKLTTTHATKTTTGAEKPAGFPLRDMISLTATEKYDPRQKLAQLKEAAFGDKAGAFGDPATYVGRQVTVRIGIEASEEFGNQNRVKAYVKQA